MHTQQQSCFCPCNVDVDDGLDERDLIDADAPQPTSDLPFLKTRQIHSSVIVHPLYLKLLDTSLRLLKLGRQRSFSAIASKSKSRKVPITKIGSRPTRKIHQTIASPASCARYNAYSELDYCSKLQVSFKLAVVETHICRCTQEMATSTMRSNKRLIPFKDRTGEYTSTIAGTPPCTA
jgi:hypothetical protein